MTERIQRDQLVLSETTVPLSGGDSVVIANDGIPTQVANPRRAVLRTLVANLAGFVLLLPTINAVLAALQRFLQEQTYYVIPGWVWLVVNGAAALFLFISMGITRLLAVPGVNEWIKAHLPALAAIPLERRG